MNGIHGEITRQVQIHDLEDLNQVMQVVKDIEDGITKAYGKNHLAQPSIHLVGGLKVGLTSDMYEPSKQKRDFGLVWVTYLPSPK